MRKFFLIFASFLIGISIVYIFNNDLQNKSFQKDFSCSRNEMIEINEVLSEYNIVPIDVTNSSNVLISDITEPFEGFDIIDTENNKYTIILNGDDKSFTALIDNENYLIYGIIDNGVLPTNYSNVLIK